MSKVDTSSVGFGPIDLKFGMWAKEEVTYKEKSKPNCYSMLRAKPVDMWTLPLWVLVQLA